MSERFWSKVARTSGCWLWTGTISVKGYGRWNPLRTGLSQYAHRAAYELLVGPVPQGYELDHLCRVRHCVNPEHLEVVTHTVNVRRGVNYNKLLCKAGHVLSEGNVYVEPTTGWRKCRTCRSLRMKAWHQRNKRPS